jgi:maleylacetoacetate isomerase
MKLYGSFLSSACYHVRIALNIKRIKVEHVPVNLQVNKGELWHSQLLAKNPQGLVPVLELDDGTLLTQSGAIMEYLDASTPEPRLIPTDPVFAAKVRNVAMTIACNVHPLNSLRVLKYLSEEMALDQVKIDQWGKHWLLKNGLEAVEQLIEPGPFCFGSVPTLADLYLVSQIFSAYGVKCSLEHLPKILSVNAACTALAAFRDAHPSQQADAE